MTDFTKVLTDMPLDSGAHEPGKGACVMEKVAILWALHSGQDVESVWSDLPACTNIVIAKAAQTVNDHLTNTKRQRLNLLIPRLLRARRTDSDQRVNTRLAVWAARRVLDRVRPEDRAVCEQAVEAAEAWLADPTEAKAHAANASAHAANAAAFAASMDEANASAHAANASAHAANAAAHAANAAAYAAHAAAHAAGDTPIAFLDGLLDAWEEAVTKEGEDLYVPQEWEDEALTFVAEWLGESK